MSSASPLSADQTSLAIHSSSFSHLTATFYGSMIFNTLSLVTVQNSFVDNNTASSLSGVFFNAGGSYDCTSSCSAGSFGLCHQLDECQSCELGECKECDAGRFLASSGGVASSQCSACGAGTFSNQTGLKRTHCKFGKE